ncbi:MAG: hypothetical protein AMR96_01670 [Candidatus Adiutrix intracellularis]|nr:MAG: hypothetical protein AMR96_01670 [Candidatus Adiutrix intracellularis]
MVRTFRPDPSASRDSNYPVLTDCLNSFKLLKILNRPDNSDLKAGNISKQGDRPSFLSLAHYF